METANVQLAIEKRVHPTAQIFGMPINLARMGYILAEMDRVITAGEVGHYISITNTELMYHSKRNPGDGKYVREADFSLCDGIGVVAAGLVWGCRVPRVNGPILQLEASDFGRRNNWRHFFYGGNEGVADEMARRLKVKYPGLNIVGTYCPPFRPLTPEEDEQVVAMINATKPDIVWVGLGLPKQERWIAPHLHRVRACWMVGVGGAFDYHSGNVPWAPAILRALGLEWVFRLIVQPKLRFKRYWWSLVWAIQAIATGSFTFQFLRGRVHSSASSR